MFKRHFLRAKEVFWASPFKSCHFQNAYITDILKDMTDFGVPIHTVIIERGWQEIDTSKTMKTPRTTRLGTLMPFFQLNNIVDKTAIGPTFTSKSLPMF